MREPPWEPPALLVRSPRGYVNPVNTQPTSLMNSDARLRLSRAHRLLGMMVTVPLVGWVLSSFVLHGAGLALPNGLQGEYDLTPHHQGAAPLEGADLIPPSTILEALGQAGLTRLYWLRLEALAGVPAYVVKPGPFELEWVFDARTGARMDPLSDGLLRAVADGELVDTRTAGLGVGDEFNRYYALDRIPAVAVEMEGGQPSELVLSRASGRVLRRTDPLAAWFDRAYRSVHVWQWGASVGIFTALLFTLVGLALMLVSLGYVLWFDRREKRRHWTGHVRTARRAHAKLAPWAGLIVSTQMLVGAYLWFNLGLIEPRFRGQGSFREEWGGGIRVEEVLAPSEEIAAALPREVVEGAQPIQRYEWRAAGRDRFWVAYPERDAEGILLNAGSGQRLERLTPEQALAAAGGVVLGTASGSPEESTEYWMDANARIPTYLFRFTDPDRTDVHVAQMSGEVVQRRPAIWRLFGPFLAYHTFGFTGNPWLDTVLLSGLQLTVLAMVFTGWRLVRHGSKRDRETIVEPE